MGTRDGLAGGLRVYLRHTSGSPLAGGTPSPRTAPSVARPSGPATAVQRDFSFTAIRCKAALFDAVGSPATTVQSDISPTANQCKAVRFGVDARRASSRQTRHQSMAVSGDGGAGYLRQTPDHHQRPKCAEDERGMKRDEEVEEVTPQTKRYAAAAKPCETAPVAPLPDPSGLPRVPTAPPAPRQDRATVRWEGSGVCPMYLFVARSD